MKPLLFLISSLISLTNFSQQWGNCTISQFTNEANDVEINNNNESYTAGYITGETAFSPANTVLSAQGNGDIYIAKYAPSGVLIWQRTFGGSYSDRAIDLAIGDDQNIVVTGQFFGTVTFGSIVLNSSANSKDIFIVKLDPAGNVLWARSEGGNLAENAYGITVDHQNNVILTGQFQGMSTIGPNTFTSAIDPNTNLPSFDFFISKYNSNGNPLWSLNGSAEYEDRGLAVAVDHQNNIFFTGQFSKTLTFASNTYPNLGYNIGFLCKLNTSGQLQFLNQLKAGMTNPYDLEINSDNEVIITGDFLGNLNYYDSAGMHSIQNPYDRQIFVLKTSNGGNYIWNYTLGSNNELSARSISMDPHKDIFITGFFKCDLSQIQDTANALFNSVGYKDPYLLKLNHSGQFQYIKQFGGKMDDEGHGVAIRENDKPIICGSFTKDLNFSGNNLPPVFNTSLHSLTLYQGEVLHYYLSGDSTRNSFLVNYIDQNYQPLNYYINQQTDSLIGYISPSDILVTEIDTVHFCDYQDLYYNTLTWPHSGPSYSFLWDSGSDSQGNTVLATGDYWVNVKRDDACASDVDSIHAILDPTPLLPNLTDNLGINSNQPPYYHNYHFCYPDSVMINYTNQQAGTVLTTTTPNMTVLSGTGPFVLQEEGYYTVLVSNQYCTDTTGFQIFMDHTAPVDTLLPDILMFNAVPTGDSITVCLGEDVCFAGIDLFTNPQTDINIELPHTIYDAYWTISGNGNGNLYKLKTCFSPQNSGWYTVNLHVVVGYNNLCGIDTVHYSISKLFYITVNPLPVWSGNILGDNLLCENGSVFLVIDNPNPVFSWSGPGIIWNNGNDTIEINAPGYYNYSGTLIDSLTGCTSFPSATHLVTLKTAPAIFSTPADAIICPYDSVLMAITGNYVSYLWIGPEGDSLSNTNQCYGEDLGFYYVHVVDNEGCHLTSPPYELREYTTPSITISPDEFLCPGETVTIQIAYTGTPDFIWNPINSNQDHITVNSPGVYSVQITQCGLTITDSIEIIDGSFSASISISDSILCYLDTIPITGSSLSYTYEWNNGQTSNGIYSVTEPGSYSAIATNEYGCTSQTNSVTIVLSDGATPPDIASQTVCYGANVVFNSSAPYPLNWYSSTDTTFIQTGNQLHVLNVTADTSFIVAYQSIECPPAYGSVSIELIDSLENLVISGDSILCQQEAGVFSINTTTENLNWYCGTTSLGNSNPVVIPFNILNSNPSVTAQVSNQCYSATLNESVFIMPQTPLELVNDSIMLCYYDTEIAEVSTPNIDSLVWYSNNGTLVNETFPVSGSVDYGPVSVSGIDQNGCPTDTAWLYVITSGFNTSLEVNFTTYCLGDSGFISVNTNADSILWTTPTGMTDTNYLNLMIDSVHSGTYHIDYWDAMGCHYQDSVYIPLYQSPNLELLPDSIFCLNDVYTFYFPNDTNTYQWTTLANNPSIPILADQELVLSATTPHGCMAYDTLIVHTVDCDDELPNIITPNGDGSNDYFIIDDAYSQLNNRLIIFNRWGNKLFESAPYKNDFDGNGISEGVYFYLYYPKGIDQPNSVKQGFLHIIH